MRYLPTSQYLLAMIILYTVFNICRKHLYHRGLPCQTFLSPWFPLSELFLNCELMAFLRKIFSSSSQFGCLCGKFRHLTRNFLCPFLRQFSYFIFSIKYRLLAGFLMDSICCRQAHFIVLRYLVFFSHILLNGRFQYHHTLPFDNSCRICCPNCLSFFYFSQECVL